MYRAAGECRFKTMSAKTQSANAANDSSACPHSRVCCDLKQRESVSALQSVSRFHTRPCTRPPEFLIHSCHLCPPPIFFFFCSHLSRPLCVGAKQSNGCWHILELCCPTHSLSLMCRPSPWLSAPQLGSGRDKRTKAISPATNNRFQSCTFVLFTSQIGGVGWAYLYPEGQNPPHQRVLDLLMRDVCAAGIKKKKKRMSRAE